MSHTFISYARKDLTVAERIVLALAENDLNTWVDWKSIPKAEDWREGIFRGIEEADSFLFLISIDSVTSQVCNEEIDHALKNGKRIIPILIGNTKEGRVYKDAHEITNNFIFQHLKSEINRRNFIFCRENLDDFNQSIEQIKITIRTDYKWVEDHTNLQLKALEWEKRNKKGGLLNGTILREAQEKMVLSRQKDPKPTDLQRLFVNESQKAETRNRSWILTIAGVVIAVLAFLSFYANNQQILATDNEATALANLAVAKTAQVDAENQKATAIANENIARSGELAAQSVLARDFSFDLSLLLSIEAFLTADTLRSETVLFDNTQAIPYLERYLSNPYYSIAEIQFSTDGNLLASSDTNNDIRLWDVNSGEQIGAPLHIQTSGATDTLAFNNDGNILAIGGHINDSIVLWNIKNNSIIELSFTDCECDCECKETAFLAFAPNGQTLVSASNNTLFLWDIETHKNFKIKSDNFGEIQSLAFSPDGKILAVAGINSKIFLINFETLEFLGTPMEVSSDRVGYLDFSPDGKTLASGDDSNEVTLWDVETHQSISILKVDGSFGVGELSFSKDGYYLVAASYDDINALVINWWEVSNPSKPIPGSRQPFQMKSTASDVGSISLNPANWKVFATGSNSKNKILLLDMDRQGYSNHWVMTKTRGSGIQSITADGKILATVTFAKNNEDPETVNLWDIGSLTLTDPSFYAFSEIKYIEFSPEGDFLAMLDASNTITLKNVATKQIIGSPINLGDKQLYNLAISPDGKTLAVGGSDKIITIWDIKKETISFTLQGYSKEIKKIEFSPNGKFLSSWSSDGSLTIWDIKTQQIVKQITTSGFTVELTFNDNGDLLAYTNSNTIVLWDMISNQQIGQPLVVPNDNIGVASSLAFSNNGEILASGHYSGAIILWDVSTHQLIGQPVFTEIYPQTTVRSLIFSSEDEILIASGDSLFRNFVILLSMDPHDWAKQICERTGRNFTRVEWAQYFPNEDYRKTCGQWDLEPQIIATPTITP